MAAQVAQHAANSVGVIIVAVAAVIHGVPAGAMGVALQQSQLAQQTWVIGQAHQATREQW